MEKKRLDPDLVDFARKYTREQVRKYKETERAKQKAVSTEHLLKAKKTG